MVPRADFIAASTAARVSQEEAQAKTEEVVLLGEELARAKEQLMAARNESARLQAAIGDMVPRAELLAAQSEVRVGRDATVTLAADMAALEEQLSHMQQQYRAAQKESEEKLQAAISNTVARSELSAARARAKKAENDLLENDRQYREAIRQLNEKVDAMEQEKHRLLADMKVIIACCLANLSAEIVSPSFLQTMVPRSELTSALVEANTSNTSAKALARAVEDLKQQLSRANEQCKAGNALRSEMVPLSEFAAARASEEAASASALAANERLKEIGTKLETRLAEKEEELDGLITTLQVPSNQ
jgi:hypothetical protein